jgi:hypothetical protein
MAEPYGMADYLQGRQRLVNAMMAPPRSFAPSEYTTPDEMRQERISQALGWDTTRPGRAALERLFASPQGAFASFAMRPAPAGPVSLSPNFGRMHNEFRHDIMQRNFPVGTVRGYLNPYRDQASIGMIRAPEGANTLGPTAMRQLMREFRQQNPSVETVEGFRISGARARDGIGGELQTVRMPRPQGAARVNPPMERQSSQPRQGPTQGQRDLYSLEAHRPNEVGLVDFPDEALARSFHRGLDQFQHSAAPSSIPPSNAPVRGPTQVQRDYSALYPFSAEERYLGSRHPQSNTPEARAFYRALGQFRDLPRPPNNRLNALLPFAGAAGDFVPPSGEQY